MAVAFRKLSRVAIRRLAVGDRIEEHGIKVQRMKSGDLRYSVAAMVDGVRINRVVGYERDGVTREQAEQFLQTVRTRAREDRLDLPTGRKLHRSFAEAADEYLRRLVETNGKNLKPKAQHLRTHLLPALGQLRLDKLSELTLSRYRSDRARVRTR